MRHEAHIPTYRSWSMMKNRCLNPNAADFKHYGGRGIYLAPAWVFYDSFLSDMGERPPGTTLERKNSELGYTPDNCVWETRLVQSRNRNYTLDLEYRGRIMKVWEWAEELRIRPHGVHHRLWRHKTGQITLDQVFQPNRRTK